MVQSNFANAYLLLSPDYRNKRALKDFGEKYEFVRSSDYELRPTRYLKVRRDRAMMVPWKGHPTVASGPGFEFSKIGTNWFLTGELEWFSN